MAKSGKNPTRAEKHREKDETQSNHMTVSVMERFALLQLIASYKPDFVSMRIAYDLNRALSLTEGEMEEIEFKQEGNSLTWNPRKAAKISKTVVVGKRAREIITKQIESVKELDTAHYELYARFVEFPGEEDE